MLTRTRLGTNEDGSPLFHYGSDKHVIFTGKATGVVTMADGKTIEVDSPWVELDTPEEVQELDHRIGLLFETQGHPDHTDGEPFYHFCTAARCGAHQRPDSDPGQAMALVRAQKQFDGAMELHPHEGHIFGQAMGFIDPEAPLPDIMALASAAAENAALNGLDGTGSTNVIPFTSLHTASPGTTGANENANSGGYTRPATSWNAASGGNKTNSGGLSFSTLGTVAVTHFGTQSSATYGAGNYALGGALTSSVTAASITIASGAITLAAA